jgi:signal transduction histidine kinase
MLTSYDRIRVLVVDDDEDDFIIIRDALRSVDNSNRITVDWRPTYAEGLDALARSSVDVCLLDYRLSDTRDGLGLLAEANARGIKTPIIMITGLCDAEVYRRAMRAGAADYIIKARLCEATELEKAIFHALERSRTTAALMVSDRMVTMGTLAAGVAHEINNPLAAVIGNLDVLSSETEKLAAGQPMSSDDLREMVEILDDARGAAERVRIIVRDLKMFSRVDEEARQAIELRRVLEGAIKMTWNEIRHRARLVKDYAEAPLVYANEARLGQVFLNLILNAAHAIPEGSAERNEIRLVTSTDSAGRALVEIRDTGAGIPEEVRHRIFEPFFTTKPLGVGTGLGLSITYNIVTRLGGTIDVETALGRGTTFRVTLPASAVVEDAAPCPIGNAAPTRSASILILDDDAMVARAAARAIGREHETTIHIRGQKALDDIATGKHFDLVLCDVMMPELSGEDFYREVGRIAPDLLERIIFMTGSAFTPTARAFLARVPNLRIEKPFGSDNLRALVRARLQMNEAPFAG